MNLRFVHCDQKLQATVCAVHSGKEDHLPGPIMCGLFMAMRTLNLMPIATKLDKIAVRHTHFLRGAMAARRINIRRNNVQRTNVRRTGAQRECPCDCDAILRRVTRRYDVPLPNVRWRAQKLVCFCLPSLDLALHESITLTGCVF